MRTETRFPVAPCPYCEYLLDTATHISDQHARPSPGDCTVCLGCAQILLFDARLAVRKPFMGEMEAVFAEQPELRGQLTTLQDAVRAIDRSHLSRPSGRA